MCFVLSDRNKPLLSVSYFFIEIIIYSFLVETKTFIKFFTFSEKKKRLLGVLRFLIERIFIVCLTFSNLKTLIKCFTFSDKNKLVLSV